MHSTTNGLWCGLLGPLTIRRAGTALDLGPPKQRVLALHLLLQDGRAVSTDRLCEDLWPGRPTPRAVVSLQAHISRLRAVLEPGRPRHGKAGLLVRESHGYALRVPAEVRDTVRFEQVVVRARHSLADGRAQAARKEIEYALSLWRGAALQDARDYMFAQRQAARLEAARAAAEEMYVCTLLHDGDVQRAIGVAEVLTARHPLREVAWGLLMCGLYLTGRHADALARFQELRGHLAEELGLQPSPAIGALQEAILRHDVEGVRRTARSFVTAGCGHLSESADLPGASSSPSAARGCPVRLTPTGAAPPDDARQETPLPGHLTVRPAQLPADPAFFVGRRAELAAMHDMAGTSRPDIAAPPVLLVGGVPGVGKTTFALRFAHQVAHRFPDGQLFADLCGFDSSGSVADPADILQEFLSALGVAPTAIPTALSTRTALLRTVLSQRRVLLVLDNARDEAQIRPLLPAAPGCLTIVTSRNELHGLVTSEGAGALTLDVPSAQEGTDALTRRLGSRRVRAEPQAAEDIVRLCARLPLALAIAAARATLHPEFSLRELADELRAAEGSLDAFSGTDDSTDVRAVFSWSYRALSPQAARLFRLLALHPGPAVSAPAAASLARLTAPEARAALVELTRARMVGEPAAGRYALHDLLRVYAGELVREHDTEQERTAALHRMYDHYLYTAVTGGPSLSHSPAGPPPPPPAAGVTPELLMDIGHILRWYATEQYVLRGILRQAADTGFTAHACGIAWSLHGYLDAQGRSGEAAAVLSVALKAAEDAADRGEQARLHRAVAGCLGRMGLHVEGMKHLDTATELLDGLDDLEEEARVHLSFASLLHREGRNQAALRRAMESLRAARRCDDPETEADACNGVGWLLTLVDRDEEALSYCRRSIALFHRLGIRLREAHAWDSLAHAHHHLGQYRRATDCYDTALELMEACGDVYTRVGTLIRLGDTHLAAGSPEAARATWLRALRLAEEQPDVHPIDGIRERLSV